MDKICDNNPTMKQIEEHKDETSDYNENNNSNLKLISIENGADGLGIKLSKSSWDPYPFISFVDETREQRHDLQIGDCLLKVLCWSFFAFGFCCEMSIEFSLKYSLWYEELKKYKKWVE